MRWYGMQNVTCRNLLFAVGYWSALVDGVVATPFPTLMTGGFGTRVRTGRKYQIGRPNVNSREPIEDHERSSPLICEQTRNPHRWPEASCMNVDTDELPSGRSTLFDDSVS